MQTNGRTGQLKGPFTANQELIDLIKEDAVRDILYVHHIGITAKKWSHVFLNDKEIKIGKTGIYEVDNAEITSIKFKNDMDKNTIIDYTIILEDEIIEEPDTDEDKKENQIISKIEEDKAIFPVEGSVMMRISETVISDSLRR